MLIPGLNVLKCTSAVRPKVCALPRGSISLLCAAKIKSVYRLDASFTAFCCTPQHKLPMRSGPENTTSLLQRSASYLKPCENLCMSAMTAFLPPAGEGYCLDEACCVKYYIPKWCRHVSGAPSTVVDYYSVFLEKKMISVPGSWIFLLVKCLTMRSWPEVCVWVA